MRRELTAYEIAEAFPLECREYCPSSIHTIELKLIKKRAEHRRIELLNVSTWDKNFGFMINEMCYPIELQKRLDTYKLCLELINEKDKDKWFADKHAIAMAKSKPIEDIYDFQGIRKQLTRLAVLCPFHQEKTPSFIIYRTNNTFHCFGCSVSGDSIDFMMKLNKISFKKAVEALQ